MCLSPITVKDSCNRVRHVPCGKCIQCVARYQQDWSFRLDEEMTHWKYSYYLTLTYDDCNCPRASIPPDVSLRYILSSRFPECRERNRYRYDHSGDYDYLFKSRINRSILVPTCDKSHVQNYIKRIRERYYRDTGSRLDIKYFLCSEYGPKTWRPHYHVIFFTNLPLQEFTNYIVTPWHYGNVDWSHQCIQLNEQGDYMDICSYVSKYICKPQEFVNPYESVGIVAKTFRLMSKGIGKGRIPEIQRYIRDYRGNRFDSSSKYGFSEEYLEYIYMHTHIYNNGYMKAMPRIWRDSVFSHRYRPKVRFLVKSDRIKRDALLNKLDDYNFSPYIYRKIYWCYEKNPNDLLAVAFSCYSRDRYYRYLPPLPECVDSVVSDCAPLLSCRTQSASLDLQNSQTAYTRQVASYESIYRRSTC